VLSALRATSEARTATAVRGDPPLPELPDLRPVLARCRVAGTVLDGAELVQILPTLRAVPPLSAYGASVRESAPGLAVLLTGLPWPSGLADALGRAIDDDGAVKDQASARLAGLRRELRHRRARLLKELEHMVQAGDDRIFADRFVTVRHGRYVVPIRAEARTRISGIVHDRSQSGQTLFVEPAAYVEANNDLAELAREEEGEIARVIAELTDAVRARLPELDRLVETLADLDWAFARGRAAERMGASAPLIGGGTVALREARHPLLVAQSWNDPARPVVPIDLELDGDRPLLVITGPNAGGKTVALKTLALSAMMAQTGCHVPAADGSQLPLFDAVHAIIGDEQSVAENLSTFSAFVRQVRDVLAKAGPGSLVLLDELGAGTDPDEGAALAQAILESLAESGALVVASTHLEPLKAFASTHPRARNAAVEFDADALAPTFRIRYDRPGQSYALMIAGRLGLPPELIARAQAHRSADAARVSALLERLDENARRETSRVAALDAQTSAAAAHLATARETEERARSRAREIVDGARAEATALLADVRRAVNAEWDRLKRADRSRPALEDGRRRLRQALDRIVAVAPPAREIERDPLGAGACVRADHLGLHGEIVAVAGSTATVRSGSVTVRVPLSALRRADGIPDRPRPGPPPVVAPAVREIPPELLLLGRTTDEARDMVERYLDDAFVGGLPAVRLVHGKGTGALRKAVRELLSGHPLVESFRDGDPSEGGAGATVAQLKVS
jgi:DNA mismatch repair protein MutS2